MRFKPVFRYDPQLRMVRLFRVLLGRRPGDPGHRAKLSLAIWPRIVHFARVSGEGWEATLLGLRVHYLHSAGGGMV